MALDFIPIVGQLKAAEEVWSGKELFSGERMNRGLAALGLVPGGKLAYTALKGLGKTGSTVELLVSKTVANKSLIRTRVEANIAQTRKGIDNSNFLAYRARYNQLEIGYGADIWSMGYLKKGELVYGGLPAPSAFYTDLQTVLASGGDKSTLFKSLQVKPDPLRGYRPEIGVYKINRNMRVPMG